MRIHQDARVVFVVLPFSFLIIIYGFGPPPKMASCACRPQARAPGAGA